MVLGHQHLAGLAALEGADNALFLHLIHQAGGAGIAHLEPPLQQRSGGKARFHHHGNGLLQQLVAAVAVAFGGRRGGGAASLALDLGGGLLDLAHDGIIVFALFPLLDEGDDTLHLAVGHKAALHAGGLAAADRIVQHIAAAQQLFGAAHIQNGAGVDLRGNGKGNTAGNVGLDEPGDDIHRGTLGGDHQVHTGGTGHLRQAADVILDVLGGGHHQVRQLIDDNDDLRHGPKLLPRGGQTVIALQVAGAGGGKHLVAVEHLPDRPAQRAGGLFGVGDDRHQQMRNAVVAAQLHHLGVDHQQLNLLGRGLVQQADDDGIDADRLAAAGGAGDEQVRHFGQIRQADASGDILAQRDRKPAFGVDELLAVDDLPDGDGGDILVGDFDADGSLVGDGRFDTHPAGS